MKVLKTLIAVLVSSILIFALIGCGSKTDDLTSSYQEYTVKKGDISLTITAAGNLALSLTEDLVVDLFYPAGTKGTIGSILVEEGEMVKEGQVLVTLDTDEWNDQLDNLQKALSTAQRNVITKTTALTDAERQLTALQRTVSNKKDDVLKAQRNVTSKQLAVTQAELNVVSANNSLHDIIEVRKIQDNIDHAEFTIQFCTNVIGGNLGGGLQVTDLGYWLQLKAMAQTQVAEYYSEKRELLSGNTTSEEVALLVLQRKHALDQAQLSLENAQVTVADAEAAVTTAQIAVDDANYAITKQQQTIENARLDLEDAQNNVVEAEQKLADAQGKSPEIKASFDGFITDINVEGGDEVLNGTVAITVADPNRFEADILVSEMDIMKVGVGGDATISLNAMPDVKLPAKITHIAPTATISSGVVNYVVKVEIDAEVASRLQTAGTRSTEATTANATGQLSPMLQRMVDAGRITQEQAEEFQESGSLPEGFSPREGITLPEGFTPPTDMGSFFSRSQSSSQLPSSITQNFQLKQGLTGTVELIIIQKNNVLLVPNAAVSKAGPESSVEVLLADGTTEKRVVEVGLNDWQNTEIISGLSEGEIILIPKSTVTTSSSSSSLQERGPGGGFFFGR